VLSTFLATYNFARRQVLSLKNISKFKLVGLIVC
jgi:hypothetical protein